MSNNIIESVVFDIGNVLIRWDPKNLYRQMGYPDAKTDAIMAETRLPEINHRELDAGAPYEATCGRLAECFPQYSEFILAFHTGWPRMLGGAIAENAAILKELRQAAMPVHAISNFSREKFDIARVEFPFLDDFDELIVSGDVKIVKPDAEIFKLLIERSGIAPTRSIFIDDSVANIAAAQALGFRTVHFAEGKTDLRQELKELGCPFL